MNYDNKTFCVLPFIHKHTRLSNQDTVCCNSQIAVRPEDINNIRQKLLTGEKIKHCRTCYAYEDQGIISPRMKENERWLADTEVKNYIETYTPEREETTFSYDLRYSNICNLACIGCMPQQSSLWAKEMGIETKPINFKFDLAKAKNAKYIYLAGGEPFLTTELIDLLKNISQLDNQPFVCINTNLTVQDDEIKEICSKLKYLTLAVSFDGVGKVAEYHRWPIKWKKFERNLEWASSLGCNILFNTVVDAVNVSFIHEILEYEHYVSDWNLTPIQNPIQLRVENLPNHLKQSAHNNFIKLMKSNYYTNDSNFKNKVDSIAKKILEEGSPTILSNHIQNMDNRRKINHIDFLEIDLK
jgi:MoaA/NifB/PqqE/SkfB family radical SAM enzyme